MKQQKTLYILRHAKTETASAGQEDFNRRLTERGVNDARIMGNYILSRNIRPDKVLCSTAVRTRETLAQLVFPSSFQESRIEYTDKLYHALANEMLTLLSAIEEPVHSLMVIGHNPGLHELCVKLAKKGDDALISLLAAQLPTCALVTIVFEGSWRDIRHAPGTLAGFVTPRMLGT